MAWTIVVATDVECLKELVLEILDLVLLVLLVLEIMLMRCMIIIIVCLTHGPSDLRLLREVLRWMLQGRDRRTPVVLIW